MKTKQSSHFVIIDELYIDREVFETAKKMFPQLPMQDVIQLALIHYTCAKEPQQ